MFNEGVADMERNREPINTKEPESLRAMTEIVTEEKALISEIDCFSTGHFDEPRNEERAPQNPAELLRRIQEALWK